MASPHSDLDNLEARWAQRWNGLPTERRAENYFGVRCDPSVAYQEDFEEL